MNKALSPDVRKLWRQFRSDPRATLRRWHAFGRREILLVITVAICAVTLFGFIAIADEMSEGETHATDESIVLVLRETGDPGNPIGPLWVQRMARDITSLGSIAVLSLVSLASIAYLLMIGKYGPAIQIFIATSGGLLLSNAMKGLFDRPRPSLVPAEVQGLNASFPSGHAMLAAVTYFTLAAFLARVQPNRRTRIYFLSVAFIVVFAVGVSRVYLALHWPTDVLAGWCLGAGWASLCWIAADILQRRRV